MCCSRNSRRSTARRPAPRASTDVPGLDEVLEGGLLADHLYLVDGNPGAGKTTLALQFLREGLRLGETVLYVTLSETQEELASGAASHGWSMDGIHIVELVTDERLLEGDEHLTMDHPAELELTETTRKVLDTVRSVQPQRLVLDSLSELRLLAQGSLRYRRQILALKQFFIGRHCTVLLLGGGIDRGTATLLIGPPGTGKSTLALQDACAAASRGEHAAVFSFEESQALLLARAAGIGLSVRVGNGPGELAVRQIHPTEISPGEFAHGVRRSVEADGARVVIIDSLNGYLYAMPGDRALTGQLHELLAYLNNQGVATFLVAAQAGTIGPHQQSTVDASYLADTVVLLRMFEHEGRVKKAVSVLKKRCGPHSAGDGRPCLRSLLPRVDRTLDRAQGGLGIGLALVRSLVALHGGSAQAASAGIDQGSSFTVSLPLIAPQSPASAPAGGHAIDGVDRQLRVLVVDDNADAADSLSIHLEGGGHITRTVYNAADGLAALDDFGPHIVFCDVGMPGMDGHTFAARLRADPRHADRVLVALTGWGADDDKRRTRRSGFDHHLVRPANWAVIAALLATL